MAEEKIPEVVQLIQHLEACSEAEQREVYDYLRKKELENIQGKIVKMPDIANDEFKIFDDRKIDKPSTKVIDIRKRRYALFCYYYAHPSLTDEQMVSFILIVHPDMSYVQAVRDLNKVKMVMGNMPRARKELIRFQVIEMFKRNHQRAEALDYVDGMNAATTGIGRFSNLDKESTEINWDDMTPPDMEPTDEIKTLNPKLKKYTDAERDKLRKKYTGIEMEQ
jgi:hypothetical protein